ncbi:MAG TPA: cellulase family glycosylhydrolase, partial [Chitinophagaceae bacterium]|nr:cellulase family glycosylhydrolase [Chitinophagaceae bacterium]
MFVKQFIIIISVLFFSDQIYSQGILRVNGKSIINGEGQEIILRGMGLGGWMLQEPYMLQLGGIAANQSGVRSKIIDLVGEDRTNTFYNAWLANHCRKADIDSLAAWGFNSARLPMHYNLFTPATEQEPVADKNTWLPKGFQLTDSLLSWCKANKIYLILDLHAAPGGQGNDIAISDRDTSRPSLWQSELNKQKTIALWRKLAERYAKEPWIGGYDIINETNWGFQNATDKNGCAETGNAPLKKLLTDITDAIRQVDKKHIIFIEANCWANNYNGIFPLWDNNIVVSFHKYWNYNDQQSIQKFIDIREKYNVPVWCGESGENSNTWFTAAIELFEKNKIGWAWWPLKKFGLNNPLQVKQNNGYKQLISYWKGQSSKPSREVAFNALMQLTEDIKAEDNVVHKDVTDAMFRQVHSFKTKPFKQHIIKAGTIVFAVDYDLGRNGFAYFDDDSANYHVSTGKRTPGNRGGQYRNDGVDIEACTDALTNGFNVNWIEDGEWLQYTMNVTKTGSFNLNIRTAANDTAEIKLTVNNVALSQKISLVKTAGENEWKTTTVKNFHLTKGLNRFKILAVKGG